MTTDLKLTNEQKALFGEIQSKLRQECALAFISNGYENKKQSYLTACEILNKKPSKNPEVSGVEILGYPNVIAFLDSVRVMAAESANIDAAWLLGRLKDIDSLDVLDIMLDDLSGFKSLSEWPKVWRTSLSGVDIMHISGEDTTEGVMRKVKWPDKVKNLEMIGRHVSVKAWDKEVNETVVTNNIMPVPTAASAEDWEQQAKQQQEKALSHE